MHGKDNMFDIFKITHRGFRFNLMETFFAHLLTHLTVHCRIAQDYSTQINKKKTERIEQNRKR